MVVEPDDRRVGERVLDVAERGEVGVVDLDLRGAGAERGLGGAVRGRGLRRRRRDRVDFPVALVRALPVEARDERLRVHARGRDPVRAGLLGRGAHERGARAGRSDLLPGRLGCRHLHDVEFAAHEVGRGRGRRVPVVARLDAHEARPLARHEIEQMVRAVHGRPVREVGRRMERRVVVVGEVRERDARVDQQPVESGLLERAGGRRGARGDVGGVGREGSRHRTRASSCSPRR